MPDEVTKRKRRSPALLDAEALWSYAVKTLGRRALSAAEIRQRLARKAAEANDVGAVMSRLREYGYIDDAKMAETLAAARRDSRGYGKYRVLRDLQARRVGSNVARQAVDEAFAGTDEIQLIEQYLERKYRGKAMSEFLAAEKNLASAYRRLRTAGFSSGASIRVLKRYAARAEELEDLES
jgi:regulatory protein